MEYSRQYSLQFPNEEFTQDNHFIASSKIILILLLFLAIVKRRAIFEWVKWMVHERVEVKRKSEKREENIRKKRGKEKALRRRMIIEG